MDAIDYTILVELIKDAKKPIKQIADKVNLSITPVHDRIKRMEKNGVIEKYAAIINPNKLDFTLIAFMQIKLKEHQKDIIKNISVELDSFAEVLDGYYTTGEFDVLLKVMLKDMNDYNDFILERIAKIKSIDNIRTSFVIKSIIHEKEKCYSFRPVNISR
jgi:Lrp/AsnC family leucine-responsive transcriptional regulator